MAEPLLIVGGGIGGLAAALASSRAGYAVQVFEQAPEFSEVGAGIQLGPNVTRILRAWGLLQAMADTAAFPSCLQARSALSAEVLASLPLDRHMQERYGAPYATMHRADLHALLLQALRASGLTDLRLNHALQHVEQTTDEVHLRFANQHTGSGVGLIGADGLWSRVREDLLDDGPPRLTGHMAFRALVRQDRLPAALRSQQVTVWLGPELHVVQYPVRQGDWLNLVVIVHGQRERANPSNWDHLAHASELRQILAGSCSALTELVAAVDHWRLWMLCDRPPMRSAAEHARGRVALLGDAAHPVRPYLAQGAGMAIEDAAALGDCLAQSGSDIPAAWQGYAQQRWQRNARVQARAVRQGTIFHARGPLRWARDAALRLLGKHLMDQHWL
ncbi:MAG: FAD-dependent monooxygenase, partial [Hylemonella sp.]